jgi:hypothetical protein
MCRLMQIVVMLLILCFLFPLAGAAENEGRLISDLNTSAETNAKARADLIRIGKDVLPLLLEEAGKYKYLTADDSLRAARALRVIREMGSEEAIPLCADILFLVQGEYDAQVMLLNEALDYLYANFKDMRARDAYCDLLKNHESKWLALEKDFVKLFVFNGIPLLAENDDPRVDETIAFLLKKLPYEPPKAPGEVGGRWTCMSWLASDGYTLQNCTTTVATFNKRTDRGPSCFYDAYYRERVLDARCRYRLTCLQLAKEQGSKRLIPTIEPLLKSRHRDECDLALVTIEMLNKKQDTVPEKFDKIALTNGDVLTGTIQNISFTLVTPYASVTLAKKDIKTILSDPNRNKTIIELYSGDRMSGSIQDIELKIDLKTGGETMLKMSEIESIIFGR